MVLGPETINHWVLGPNGSYLADLWYSPHKAHGPNLLQGNIYKVRIRVDIEMYA